MIPFCQATHNVEYAQYVWWYHIKKDKLECYPAKEANRHLDDRFTPTVLWPEGWVRGRVVKWNDASYLLIYDARVYWGKQYSPELLRKVKDKVSKICHIDFVVDELCKEHIVA